MRVDGAHRRAAVVGAGLLAALILLAAAPSQVAAGTTLWLYPDSQDPRQGGHVLDTGSFTLNIENRGSGNGDNTAYDVTLILAVNDAALLAGGTLVLANGDTVNIDPGALLFGSPVFSCSGHTFPPHGVYPAYLAEVLIDDIAQGEVVKIDVELDGVDGLRAHFDARAVGYKEAGHGTTCFDVKNPSGHDVSVVLGDGGVDDCPRLEIDKTASSAGVDLGDQVDYTITIENTGTCDVIGIVVSEDIPTVAGDDGGELPAFTVVEVDPAPTTTTDTALTWELGDMAVGDAVTLTVTVVFDEPTADGRRVVNTACVTADGLDSAACDRAAVAVGDVADDGAGSPGFWCNQIRFALEDRHNAKFTLDELEQWLEEINQQSMVFSEVWDTTTLELARDLLCRPSQASTPADRLARHLLALWLNVVSGRLDPELALGDLCAGSVPPPAGMDAAMTIAELISNAETDVLGGAGDDILGFWGDVVDFVNNARPARNGECEHRVPRRGGGRH